MKEKLEILKMLLGALGLDGTQKLECRESETQEKEIIKKYEGKYIVRTYSAGVFYGEIEQRVGQETVIKNARRIWYWSGANSLSELAINGTKNPDECKFSVVTPKLEVLQTIELIKCSDKAITSIEGVKEWKK